MPDVIYYNGASLINSKFKELSPKVSLLSNIWKIGTVNRLKPETLPIRHSIMFPTVDYSVDTELSYKDCAMNRMADLDAIHKRTGYPFRLYYSGGIDSTTILACFIEYYGLEKTSQLVEICCSKESILENPWLWDRYIRPANFKISSSIQHSYMWEDPVISVLGEFNDQVLGGEPQMVKWINFRNGKDLYTTPDLDLLIEYFSSTHPQCKESYNARFMAMELLEAAELAPYKIETFFQMFSWWGHLNYWHGKYFAMMSSTVATKVDLDFFENKYFHFFFSDDFQKWSISYNKHKTVDDIHNRKHINRKLILDILDIPEYDKKHKVNSWPNVNNFVQHVKFIDSDLNIHHTWDNFETFIKRR